MVIKEMNVIFIGVLVALFLVVANGTYLSYQTEDFVSVVSGNSVKETVGKLYETSSMNHRAFVFFQFLLLIVIIAIVFMIVRKLKSKTNLSKDDFVGRGGVKYKTDLDTLYEILKRKKEVTVDDIAKVFKVNSEVALEWSRVLENGDLAIIDYPRFGKPVLRLLEKNDKGNFITETNIESQKGVKDEKVKDEVQLESKEDVVPVKKDSNKRKKIKKTLKRKKKSVLKSSKKLKKGSKLKKR